MSLRNLVHCVLALTVAFAGLAGIYLLLGAQFVGFAQILVYVGAIAILTVFAILLTRGTEPGDYPEIPAQRGVEQPGHDRVCLECSSGQSTAVPLLPRDNAGSTAGFRSSDWPRTDGAYVLPLEVIGLLLTAALIGAVILAMHERKAPDDTWQLSVLSVAALRRWSGRSIDARNAILVLIGIELMLNCGESELHRVLAVRSEPGGADGSYVRDFLDRSCCGRSGGRPGNDHRDLSALQDDESGLHRFHEGMRMCGI